MPRLYTFITLVTLLFNQPGYANPLPLPASWIAAPGDDGREYGVYYFRKQLELAARPASFIVHVSADNRYKLYVNDRLVSLSDAPEFSKIRIEPHPGKLTKLAGEMPHPNGKIAVSYQLQNGKWAMNILLPVKTSGKFIWKGAAYELKAGQNKISI